MGAAPKAGYTESVIGTTPVNNAYAFLGATFGWLCPRPVSLLARRRRSLSVLLNARRCERLWRDLAWLPFTWEGFGELLEDNSSSASVFASSGRMGFFPMSRTVKCFAYPLSFAFPSPRLCLFSIWAQRQSFSRCRCSARSCSSLICLAFSS